MTKRMRFDWKTFLANYMKKTYTLGSVILLFVSNKVSKVIFTGED